MKKLPAMMNIAAKGSVDRRSYDTFPSITCAYRTTGGRTYTKSICSTPRGITTRKAFCVLETVTIGITATRTIRNSTVTYPSFFFKINGNRDVS